METNVIFQVKGGYSVLRVWQNKDLLKTIPESESSFEEAMNGMVLIDEFCEKITKQIKEHYHNLLMDGNENYNKKFCLKADFKIDPIHI